MVKDHSDSDRGNPLPPHRLLFPINSKSVFIFPYHIQDNTYHGLCYTSRGALAESRNSSMGLPHEGSIRQPVAPRANALTTELHLAPWLEWCGREQTSSCQAGHGILAVLLQEVQERWSCLISCPHRLYMSHSFLHSEEKKHLHWICLVPRLVYHTLILNIVSANIFFPLGKMIGMVRSRTSFILLSQSWEIGSPPTGGAGRMKLSWVVPASVIHIWPIHISWGKILHLCVSTVSVFWQFGTFWWSAIILHNGKMYLTQNSVVESFTFNPTLVLLFLNEFQFSTKC